jgi:hypothetical protein
MASEYVQRRIGTSKSYGLDIALRRLELCNYAIQEIHAEIEKPHDPEERADLLLAAEALAFEVLDLVQTTRVYAWGDSEFEEEYE